MSVQRPSAAFFLSLPLTPSPPPYPPRLVHRGRDAGIRCRNAGNARVREDIMRRGQEEARHGPAANLRD
jgi:hypothetical protein